ncbi:type IV pilin [Natronobeatus ordinarius]|uniref:type IV pilin n=1 Tax=Natronobeatus ordinarius TaxID=2963433 RepID=UPI0020CBB6B0|nr:type IV pilin [Natronobeatus ordinarius]
MQVRRLPADDAVSPVVGVILLVGIVVASMAIISTMVLGTPFERTPDADLVYSEDDSGSDLEVTIAVASAEGLTEANTEIRVDGQTCDAWDGRDDIEAGDTVTVTRGGCGGISLEGETIQVIWSSGSQSALVDSYDVSG